jgi:hypothetical protein
MSDFKVVEALSVGFLIKSFSRARVCVYGGMLGRLHPTRRWVVPRNPHHKAGARAQHRLRDEAFAFSEEFLIGKFLSPH